MHGLGHPDNRQIDVIVRIIPGCVVGMQNDLIDDQTPAAVSSSFPTLVYPDGHVETPHRTGNRDLLLQTIARNVKVLM